MNPSSLQNERFDAFARIWHRYLYYSEIDITLRVGKYLGIPSRIDTLIYLAMSTPSFPFVFGGEKKTY